MTAATDTCPFCECRARWVVYSDHEQHQMTACGRHLNVVVSGLCSSPLTVTRVNRPDDPNTEGG
jgi:hypothetical protein